MTMISRLAAIIASSFLANGALAADLGFGTLSGSYLDASGTQTVFQGHLAVIDTRSARLSPVISRSQPARCPGASNAAASFALESTVAWARRTNTMLGISATFQIPKDRFDGKCEAPVAPFSNGDVSLNAPGSTQAPILALAPRKPAYVGYASSVPPGYPIVLSGNSFHKDGTIVQKSLLLDRGVSGYVHQPFPDAPHPRLAVGIRASDGLLLVLYIEGRTAASTGVSLPVLAELLKACGVEDAVNLDGGGTAQMVYAPGLDQKAIAGLVPIDISSLCRSGAYGPVRAHWTSLPLTQPFTTPAIDPCRTRSEVCTGGHEHRPLSVSFGFNVR